MLDLLIFEKIITKSRASVVQCVHGQVKLSIQHIVKDPLVIVREIMIQVDMHSVWHLYHLAVSRWIHETWPKIVQDLPIRTEFMDFCLCEILKCLAEPPCDVDMMLEAEVLKIT